MKKDAKNKTKTVEVSARTVEEAIAEAVKQLGAPDAQSITYTVEEEGRQGFLGIGSKPAKISATFTVTCDMLAVEFVKTIVKDMQLEATVTLTENENGEKVINVDGENVGMLIGHHGETLDAIQYLANLAANNGEGSKKNYSRIAVDVEGYRAKREETLRTLARRMADKVLRHKRSVMLEPMTPYERRIIHSEIQKIDGVSTNSIGSESNRKIVIYLEDKKAAKPEPEVEEVEFDELFK